MTSSYVAGTTVAASLPLLPAATTTVTLPSSTTWQIALCSGVVVGPHGFWSAAVASPSRLMLTTSIVSRWAYTQSSPQITDDQLPLPLLSRTLTAHSRAPGATPTTPRRLSLAAMVPETWVPCPLSSMSLVPIQAWPPLMLSSRCLAIPVSSTATSALIVPPSFLISAHEFWSASTRSTPVGRA